MCWMLARLREEEEDFECFWYKCVKIFEEFWNFREFNIQGETVNWYSEYGA